MSSIEGIIADVLSGYNLSVNSRSGAGKTSLLISIARAVDKKCVILTYNRALCDDANNRLANVDNCRCFTIHSLFGKQSGIICNTDAGLLHEGEVEPFQADIVMIDEAQDLRPSLYNAIIKMAPIAQYILCGDDCQVLYSFILGDEATDEYLNNGERFFGKVCKSKEWRQHVLSGSYRLTPSLADISSVVFRTHLHSLSTVQDIPVQYLVVQMFDPIVTSTIKNLIDVHGNENVLILGRSITGSGNAIRHHVNRLCNMGYKFNIREYSRGFDNAVWNKRTRVWTFCGSKGCQAKVVIVFNAERCEMTNDFGVAVSRSQKHLVLLHAPDKPVNKDLETCKSIQYLEWNGESWTRHVPVFDVLEPYLHVPRHSTNARINVSAKLLDTILGLLVFETVHHPDIAKINTSVSIDGYVEDVSPLYDKAIQYLLQLRSGHECSDVQNVHVLAGKAFASREALDKWFGAQNFAIDSNQFEFPLSCAALRSFLNHGECFTTGQKPYFSSDRTTKLMKIYAKLMNQETVKKRQAVKIAVELANHYLALDNYIDRLSIDDYSWVDETSINTILAQTMAILGDLREGVFGRNLACKSITGKAGFVRGSELVEFAFAPSVTDDQKLQLAVHASMHALANNATVNASIYNTYEQHSIKTVVTPEAAETLIEYYRKYMNT